MASGDSSGLVEKLQAEIERLKKENEKLRASNRRWMRLAGTDNLTGLPNKVYCTTALLPQLISQADAEGLPFSCILVAPDKLGDINQKYGRQGGDQIVKGLAEFLKENLEPEEKLVHLDGANFVVLIPKGDEGTAKRRSRTMRARVVSRHFACGDDAVPLTLSMGVVIRSPRPASSQVKAKEVIEELFQRLGSALDQAKKQGGDKVVEEQF
jgi:diguanylate cyclase (GGDEF)-like protein